MPEYVYDPTRDCFIETAEPELIELERQRKSGEPVDYARMAELCAAHKSVRLPPEFEPTHFWRMGPGERVRAEEDPDAVIRHYMVARPGLRRLSEVEAMTEAEIPGEKVRGDG